MRRNVVILVTIVALVLLWTSVAIAAVLDSKEAETMTLQNGADVGGGGNSARFNANGEEAVWTDGGAAGGNSVFVNISSSSGTGTQVCLILLVNGVSQSPNQCAPPGGGAPVERSWTGLSLSNSDDLLFRSTSIASGEVLFFDNARVEGTAPDTTDPTTTLNENYGTINDATPQFTFSGSDNVGVTGFDCSTNGGANWSACTSPHTASAYADGARSFQVRAKDAAGNVDETPATDSFTVDTVAPSAPTISDPASDGTTDTDGDLSFSFSGEGGATFECDLDVTGSAADSYTSCTSPKTYADQADANYTFRVRQSDAAGNTSSPATRTITVDVPDPGPYPGTRFNRVVGVAEFASAVVDGQDVDDNYDTYMKPAYHDGGDVKFVTEIKVTWRDMLVDETDMPTVTEMADPEWEGYIWNNPSHPDYQNAIEPDNMLTANCAVADDCGVGINLGLAATGGTAPPEFFCSTCNSQGDETAYAWIGSGAGSNVTRLKYYNTTVQDYVEAFVTAYMDRFDDPRIEYIKFNEYFPGPTKPDDWTSSGGQDAYEDGYYDTIVKVMGSAPTDANGDRITAYQTNPLENADAFTAAQFRSLMLGLADSDPFMFEESTPQRSLRTALHGDVPMSAPLDAGVFDSNTTTNYDGTANPFGFTDSNNSVVITVPQVAWYYGHCGPMPSDQAFVAKPGEPADGFQTALDQFGPSGSDYSSNCSAATDDWGGVPHDD
jgi:hypothetical protein